MVIHHTGHEGAGVGEGEIGRGETLLHDIEVTRALREHIPDGPHERKVEGAIRPWGPM